MDDKAPPKSNGTRAVNRMTTLLLVMQTIVVLGLVYLLYSTTVGAPRIFQAINPQTILTPQVPLALGFVKVQSTKCNLTGDDLIVGNVTYWIRDEPSYLRINAAVLPLAQGISFPPGCNTRTFENAFPEGITPGRWHIQGSNTVQSPGGQQQQVGWHTEQFEITP